jgi:hypothetical protein
MEFADLTARLSALLSSLDTALASLDTALAEVSQITEDPTTEHVSLLTPALETLIADWKAKGSLDASGRHLRDSNGSQIDIYDEIIKHVVDVCISDRTMEKSYSSGEKSCGYQTHLF